MRTDQENTALCKQAIENYLMLRYPRSQEARVRQALIDSGVNMERIDKERFVRPFHATGWNMALFGMPKWQVTCGHCKNTFTQRLGELNDGRAFASCPACRKINVLT